MSDEFVLTLTCPEQLGIVHAVSGFLLEHGCDIVDNRQFDSERFYMRVHLAARREPVDLATLRASFAKTATVYGMEWQLHAVDERPRVMIMVSRFGHCLNDLLYRWRTGQLGIDIPLIVSNHRDFEPLANTYGIPFEHVPVTRETKAEAEARLLELIERHDIELTVLARYMQVLSDDLCQKLEGRVINIHHSFLPSFKGAKPYHQAFERGVKVVGATAHYVTADLDEGPIIEQEVIRVDHTQDANQLAVIGRDAECLALSRAVQWHVERRVLLNGHRTVVFK
ncbi:formyltetrahydrofolate deformylase [Kibdelosporangium philippinense]|uniref:Formyltetrahydrofolate deformylase n=1 Tax=Kibdelosporangium philippinense TaxID=211113 RepID=A0ABS8ZC66_9PSEU|nr:formyltetrahydrofolate deformylase [Kibdelosporangium philippinense]MCE7005017.1 formyltetrahydrofolate deformylase [Kibdelosporangium philippinense]